MTLAASGCKKKSVLDDAEEQGKLPRIAARLEEAFADKSLPGINELPRLSDRLSKWDDFRSCTVRAFVAKKREADALAREGLKRPGRHASIGEAAVEECAVQAAVVNKDPSMCDRLAIDYQGPNGEMPLSAVRCWDTRARVMGLPDECPVVWLSDDVPGRNPECLALARRDGSLCLFADDPPRCHALLANDIAGCQSAAPDCAVAVKYWSDLIPISLTPPLIDLRTGIKPGEKPLAATVDVRWPSKEHPTIRIEGPQSACGVSWPAGKARVGWMDDTTGFWGAKIPPEAAQVTWKDGLPAVKIAFVPGGSTTGTRPIQPPGPLMPATVLLVWPERQKFRQCLPDAQTTGHLQFDAGRALPGSFVTGSLDAKGLACTDGARVNVEAKFRLAILDVR